jgi:NAD(P)-dependent dehydrogenase (short-subunit alcohol dehydrogenase family)
MSIALVTGGSSGLGKSISLHLADEGHDVILTYHSKQAEAEEVVARIEKIGCRAVALVLDAADHRSFPGFAELVKAALGKKWQRDDFDFLVNNAGIGVNAPFAETTEAQFDRLMNVHFKGVFFLTQRLLPLIKDGGRIVNISSGLARFSLPGFSAYAAMKGAVRDNPELNRMIASQTALGRVGLPDDIGGAVAALLSDGCRWINGQRVEVSGGIQL